MTSILCFSNPGELDLRLVTTFGANVKPASTSPIGYFGTGLKYAIAVSLRLGSTVVIQSGEQVLSFESRPETIRGKQFQMVYMLDSSGHATPCGFTLELGKNWKAWMAYRELWANAVDEGGGVDMVTVAPEPVTGETRVIVSGSEMLEAHQKRGTFILETRPRWTGASLAIHPGPSIGVFYRGFLVWTGKVPGNLTYNILSELRLTEDRVAGSHYDIWSLIVNSVMAECRDAGLLSEILDAREGSLEHEFDYQYGWREPSAEFMAVAQRAVKTHPTVLNRTLVTKVRGLDQTILRPEPVLLTKVEEHMLVRAQQFVTRHFGSYDAEVVVTELLGETVLGRVVDKTVYLSRRTFMQGTKMVAGTLVEELVHLQHGHSDCSREMQNWLLDKLVSSWEDLDGTPL